LCTELHVVRIETKFGRSFPHNKKFGRPDSECCGRVNFVSFEENEEAAKEEILFPFILEAVYRRLVSALSQRRLRFDTRPVHVEFVVDEMSLAQVLFEYLFPPVTVIPPTLHSGRAMAQAVSRRSLTAEDRVRSRVRPCGIWGGQSGTGTGFSPSTSVFPCQFHYTGVPLHGRTKKKLITFITGLHNKRQGCGASVASAAGPFTTKILHSHINLPTTDVT
jgi:hypothetical protein